jgi:hypothetical protein
MCAVLPPRAPESAVAGISTGSTLNSGWLVAAYAVRRVGYRKRLARNLSELVMSALLDCRRKFPEKREIDRVPQRRQKLSRTRFSP